MTDVDFIKELHMFRFHQALRALVSLFHQRSPEPFDDDQWPDDDDQWPELPCPTLDEQEHDRWLLEQADHMAANLAALRQCEVSFVGGPLDGYVEDLPLTPEELSIVLAVPICPALVAKLADGRHGIVMPQGEPKWKLTSVAFYERDLATLLSPRFHYLGSTHAEGIRSTWAR